MVAGATGAVAKRLVEVLTGDARWDAIGLSRNAPATSGGMRHAPVDLLDGSRQAGCAVLSRHLVSQVPVRNYVASDLKPSFSMAKI
jgi:hypothetical protein